MKIERLNAAYALQIQECFHRVYGDSYANELFYDLAGLTNALQSESLCSVGAIDDNGRILAHMAMTLHRGAKYAELGNTVVDPEARGAGLAWKVGAALTQWAVELGFDGYLHYPTTDHHIMQQQSVKKGFETGLMLGYIPAETDGQVNPAKSALRGAATIVFEPLATPGYDETVFLPSRFAETLQEMARNCGINRTWVAAGHQQRGQDKSATHVTDHRKRDLTRMHVARIGMDLDQQLTALARSASACRQLDFRLSDPAVTVGVEQATAMGFVFCGWLPGYTVCDVLRLQLIGPETDLQPAVVNPRGQQLLAQICQQLEE
ncbi:MAG: GNAT family N-acetyltransferase [Pseudomonadota bacterium]